jgi:hypothetical protein
MLLYGCLLKGHSVRLYGGGRFFIMAYKDYGITNVIGVNNW